jgi:hypothetical protein
MFLHLTPKQRAQLELISIHAGKSPAQVLMDTATYLLENDLEFWECVQRGRPPCGPQGVLAPEDLDRRFAEVLRREEAPTP